MPLITKRIRLYSKYHKPWISSAILKSIHRKHRLYKMFLKNKESRAELEYKSYKNKLTKIIRLAEKMYYSNKFESAMGSIKKTWETIKSITIGPDYINKHSITEIRADNITITDNSVIANKFNSFFSNIGPALATKIPHADGDVSDFLRGNFPNSMGIINTDHNEIINIAKLLKSSSSKGADDISSTVVKGLIAEISSPLSIIFNKSFELGQFPDKLKLAKIVPIYKAEDKTLVNNYRPISVLPFFSKILERLMYNRLSNYLTVNKILVDNQFGFREEHSTYMALLRMLNDITEELDSGNYSLGIFIDLSKAFDTVDHKLLL